MENLRSARQRRADRQKILKAVDSTLVEARPGIDSARRITTLEDIELALLAIAGFEIRRGPARSLG